MQPILSITAPLPGVVSVNGRFAGETAPDAPLLLPVAPSGALFLRFDPLEPDCLPLTRRFTLSGGGVLPQALARDVYAVAWPGGVTELEFAPQRLPLSPRRQARVADGLSYALVEDAVDGACTLAVGALEIALPKGALLPALQRRDGLLLFPGRTADGGRYLAVSSGDAARALGVIRGRQLEIAGVTVRVLVAEDDLVGHARLETWQLASEALTLESAEPVWAEGAPRWPQTAEDTVLAALQAAFLGLMGEAAAYLAPTLAASGALQRCAHEFGGVTALKYAPPDARSAVGLLRAEAPNFARVTPVYYRAAPMGGAQGPWRIERLELDER